MYVVTSSGQDHFVEMAVVSMYSFRQSNPSKENRIHVYCDEQTNQLDSPAMRYLRELSDSVVPVRCEFDTPAARSRYLKVNLLNFVQDSYVYLDSDTLIMQNLDDLWDVDADIMCVRDLESKTQIHNIPDFVIEIYNKMNWGQVPEQYFNSGVYKLTFSEKTKRFGETMAAEWQKQYARLSKINDQPVFNYAMNSINQLKLIQLSTQWNAQLVMNPLVVKDAKIVHVYSGGFEERMDTVIHVASKQLKQEGLLPKTLIDEMLKSGNPWIKLDSIKKMIALNLYFGAFVLGVKRIFR